MVWTTERSGQKANSGRRNRFQKETSVRRASLNEEQHEHVEVTFDYAAAGEIPGDLWVQDPTHVDGQKKLFAFHSNKEHELHVGEPIELCPYCGRYFWVPEGAEVHPSCEDRKKARR